MEYGLIMGLSPREPITRFSEIARVAEDLGFTMAWLVDSQLITKDTSVALTLAASTTHRIQLGPGVANPVTRHFSTISNWMAGLNEVSSGRAVLGLGTGDSSVTPVGLGPATIAEIGQAIGYIRDLAMGREVHLNGRSIRMLTANKSFPIFVAASQPRMLRLAGAVADGAIVMGGADADLTQWQLDHIAEGAKEAGRTLRDVFIDVSFAVSVSDDLEKARSDVRSWVTSQARWFSRWKELPEALKGYEGEFQKAFDSYHFSEHLSVHAGHAENVSDSLVDLIAVAGPVEKCVRKIAPLLELKVDRISFALLPGGRIERLRQLAEQVIPGVGGATVREA